MVEMETQPYQRRSVFLVLLSISLLGPLAIDVYLPALPAIALTFQASASGVQSSLGIYFLGLCLGMAVGGPLSDQFGRKPVLCCFVATFIIGSLCCAAAWSLSTFLLGRLVEAIGGGGAFVIGRILISDYWPSDRVAGTISLFMGIGWLGPVLGPPLGGELLSVSSWPSIFWLLAFIGCGSFAACVAFLPADRYVGENKRTEALRSGLAYVFANSNLRSLILCNSLIAAAYFAFLSGSPFIFINVYELSPREYSLIIALIACGLVLTALGNKYLADRMETGRVIRVFLCATLSMSAALIATLMTPNIALVPLTVVMTLLIVFQLPVQASCGALVAINSGERSGIAISMLMVATFGIGALGSFLVSLLGFLDELSPMAPTFFAIFLTTLAAAVMGLCMNKEPTN